MLGGAAGGVVGSVFIGVFPERWLVQSWCQLRRIVDSNASVEDRYRIVRHIKVLGDRPGCYTLSAYLNAMTVRINRIYDSLNLVVRYING